MTLELQERIPMELVPNRINPTQALGYGDPEDILNRCDLEMMAMEGEVPNCPLTHRFTPNLYTRELFIPKGTLATTVLHLTTHPFFIVQGDVSVWYREVPLERYKAPHIGITQAGTRRLIYAHEDTIWVTCHVTNLTDPDEIMESIACMDFNPLVDKDDPRFNLWRSDKSKLKLQCPAT